MSKKYLLLALIVIFSSSAIHAEKKDKSKRYSTKGANVESSVVLTDTEGLCETNCFEVVESKHRGSMLYVYDRNGEIILTHHLGDSPIVGTDEYLEAQQARLNQESNNITLESSATTSSSTQGGSQCRDNVKGASCYVTSVVSASLTIIVFYDANQNIIAIFVFEDGKLVSSKFFDEK